MAGKSCIQHIWDFMGMGFRLVLCPQKWLGKFGWTTLESERIRAVIPHVQGRLLDIGSGPNHLVQTYGGDDCVGVDVFDWGGGTRVVSDSADLPFDDASFDTITFVACLNHIPNRQDVLGEARRLLRPGGRIIITMIGPTLGGIGHVIWWHGEDRERGGMEEGEVGGLSKADIVELCRRAGFKLVLHKRLVYRLNNLYVFEPDQENVAP